MTKKKVMEWSKYNRGFKKENVVAREKGRSR